MKKVSLLLLSLWFAAACGEDPAPSGGGGENNAAQNSGNNENNGENNPNNSQNNNSNNNEEDVKEDPEEDTGEDTSPDVPEDVEPDAEPDAEQDVSPDVEPDAEPDAEEDVEPDAEEDVEPDVEPDADLTCAPSSRECFGNSVFVCNRDGSGYLPPVACGSDEFCREGACLEQLCEPGESLCGDDQSFRVCLEDGSGYGEDAPCGPGSYCQLGACVERVCEPGADACLGDAVARCNAQGSGYGLPTACGADQFCLDGACVAQACEPGEALCDGVDARRVCNRDGSGYGDPSSCGADSYCDGGVCLDRACQPGATMCDGNAVVTCDALGAGWSDPEACGMDELCLGGSCVPTLCTPGSRVCSGNGVLTCLQTGDGYGSPTACDGDEYCSQGACVAQVCEPLSRSCQGEAVVVCNAQGSGTDAPVACSDVQYCDGGFCLAQECEPGETVCDGDGVQTCDARGAGFGPTVGCEVDEVCLGGACVAQVCEPLTASCQGNAVVLCNDSGTGYATPVACGEGRYCEGGTCVAQVCEPNVQICEGQSVITCNGQGSDWSDPIACGNGRYCEDGQCFAQVCTPNAQTCDGDFAYHTCTANGSQYGESLSCGEGRYCDNGQCFAQTCTPDARQCLGEASYRVCRGNGAGYLADAFCPGNMLCQQATGQCVDPAQVPNAAIEVAFVRPQPNVVREMTQGETLRVLVNAVYNGGTLAGVDLLRDGQVYATDAELPYEFDFTVAANATTGADYELTARARGNDGRFNVSAAATVHVRNDVPTALFTATVSGDRAVVVDATASLDRETATGALEVRWDWENDGTFDTTYSTTKVASHTYPEYGTYTIGMQVRDAVGQVAGTTRQVNFNDISYVGGTINASTTWYGTIVVTGDVVVPNGVTLAVAEGTRVLFVYQDTQPADGVGDYGIDVLAGGSLVVSGTANNPVLFTVYGEDRRRSKSWAGIAVQGGGSMISHAIIEYGRDCLTLSDDAPLTGVELRSCERGLRVNAANGVYADVYAHDNDLAGVTMESGATGFTATNLRSNGNGAEGAIFTGHGASNLTGCEFADNVLDGARVVDALPAMTGCEIHDNGRTGVYYISRRGGSLQRSHVTENGAEGVRVEVEGSAPTINSNNIFGNSVTGGWRFMSANPNLSYSGSACCSVYRTSSTYTAPNGGSVRRIRVTYDERDHSSNTYITGGVRNSANTILWTTNSDVTNQWVDLTASSAPTQAIHLYVYDTGWGENQSISSNSLIYAAPNQSGVEMSVNTITTTVDARANYWGVFPGVLGAVSLGHNTAANLEGFVGEAFDDTWSTGPYLAGTLTTQTRSGTLYITGDVTVGANQTLTLAPGTRVLFAKHDQNGDGVGDFSITATGAISAVGNSGARIVFTGHGDVPQDGSFEYIRLAGAGSALDYVDITHGLVNLQVTGANTRLDHLKLLSAGDDGAEISSASGTTLSNAECNDNGNAGVRVYGGALTISRLQSLRNGGAGLQVDGNSANVTMSDSSLRGNEGDGATVYGGATINFSYNHFGENQNGLEVAGGVGGSATFNNISFNEREGLFLYRKGSSSPTAMFNSNNIFSNAVTEALEVGSANPNLSYSGSACCSTYRTTGTYTAPGGGSVFWVRVTYDERDHSSNAYITGGVRNSANTILWTTSSDVTNQWVDLTASSAPTQAIHLYVYDTGWGENQSISSNSLIYGSLSSADLALTGYTHGAEVVNVRGNWWGGSLNPASLISQTPSGYFDYSGFTGQAFTVGPR